MSSKRQTGTAVVAVELVLNFVYMVQKYFQLVFDKEQGQTVFYTVFCCCDRPVICDGYLYHKVNREKQKCPLQNLCSGKSIFAHYYFTNFNPLLLLIVYCIDYDDGKGELNHVTTYIMLFDTVVFDMDR